MSIVERPAMFTGETNVGDQSENRTHAHDARAVGFATAGIVSFILWTLLIDLASWVYRMI